MPGVGQELDGGELWGEKRGTSIIISTIKKTNKQIVPVERAGPELGQPLPELTAFGCR